LKEWGRRSNQGRDSSERAVRMQWNHRLSYRTIDRWSDCGPPDCNLQTCMLRDSNSGGKGQTEGCETSENGYALHKHLFKSHTNVVHLDVYTMKTDLSMAELLALVEIVDEHVDRNFPGIDPPRLLREVQQKLDSIIVQHRKELNIPAKSAKRNKAARKG